MLKRKYKSYSIKVEEIDLLDGYEFEVYVSNLLEALGFKQATVTQRSGDYGADILGVNGDNERVAIQCKRYKEGSNVGVDAIQQIHTAMNL
ncbi:restriction endonuclease [Bacillus sp. V-88]|nr:restriction endonuclease [Bacillus sp. V-88]SLK21484.1 Restriction endonuclease [Bacillus sp. V-88]